MEKIMLKGTKFVNESGREIILHGVNVLCREASLGHLYPDFCNKAKAGNVDDIDYCVGCNQGCYDGFKNVDSLCITCLRNPAVEREEECAITVAEKQKRY